jgi:hypothetical protein
MLGIFAMCARTSFQRAPIMPLRTAKRKPLATSVPRRRMVSDDQEAGRIGKLASDNSFPALRARSNTRSPTCADSV